MSTKLSLIETCYRHNIWANMNLCEACLALTEKQLDYSDAGAFGSIRLTLAHLARAEERYLFHLARWEPSITADPDTSPTITNLKARLENTGPLLLEIALANQPEDDARLGEGEETELIPASVILLQAIHHAHEHRTQIASMLGQLGIQPPPMSGWEYFDEVLNQT